MTQSLGQASFATKKIKELLPVDYDQTFDLIEKIDVLQYKKLLALAYNGKAEELDQMLKDLSILNKTI